MAFNLERFISNACCNSCQSFYDYYVEANVRFRSGLGMKAVIIRRQLGNCCKWCASLAGIYDPSDAPDDIYRRHSNCKCLVTYRSQDGYQDVWTKKIFQSQRKARIHRLENIKELENVHNEVIESVHFSKLYSRIRNDWDSLQNEVIDSKAEAIKLLKKLNFEEKFYITELNRRLKNLSGTNNVILTRDNLAYCIYRHIKQFSGPEVFEKIPEVINNSDYFKIGKSGRNDDFNFLKLFDDKTIGKYALEIKMNRVADSEEYIVHFMQIRKNKLNNILKKYK